MNSSGRFYFFRKKRRSSSEFYRCFFLGTFFAAKEIQVCRVTFNMQAILSIRSRYRMILRCFFFIFETIGVMESQLVFFLKGGDIRTWSYLIQFRIKVQLWSCQIQRVSSSFLHLNWILTSKDNTRGGLIL